MKKILSIFLAAVMLFAFAACGGTADETETVTTTAKETEAETTAAVTEKTEKIGVPMSVMALKGPTGMGLAYLMDANDKSETANEYTFTLAGDPTQVSAAVIKGETDVACVPVNLASTLYNKTGGEYICIAVNTLGVLHILTTESDVNSLADLEGKTLYATGQGSTPEYILNYILEKNGLADKVTVEYETEHTALVSMFAAGKVTLGMLPEPNVSSAMAQTDGLRQVVDLTAEWDKVSDTSAVQGCVIVSKKFASENPDALVQFMAEYAASVEYVNANVDEAAAMCETYGIVPKAAIAKRAYPNCNIVFVNGNEMKASLSAFLSVLYDANPASVGGTLPADDFYYGAN